MRGSGLKGPGFSLVELMVVMAIVSVLSAVLIPTAVDYLPTYRLNGAAREIMANLQLAKIMAVRRHTRCVVLFTPGAYAPQGQVGSYMIFLDSNNDWKATDAGGAAEEVILPTQTLPPGVSLYQAAFIDNGNGQASSTTMVGFTSHGLAARATTGAYVFGNVALRNNVSGYIRISVTAAGHVKMEKSDDGVNWS